MRNFFFLQISTLAYMTKTLNQIFFPSTKIRIFFSATLVIRIFFLENFAVYCENFLWQKKVFKILIVTRKMTWFKFLRIHLDQQTVHGNEDTRVHTLLFVVFFCFVFLCFAFSCVYPLHYYHKIILIWTRTG